MGPLSVAFDIFLAVTIKEELTHDHGDHHTPTACYETCNSWGTC
jgi:hypothetical protein